MATLLQPITIKADSATIITSQQFKDYINPTIKDHSGILQTVGPCREIPTKFIAPTVVANSSPLGWAESYTLYGIRTLADCKPGLYNLEGRVSINGKKYSAYTSSILWSVDGRLIQTAVIYARMK